MVVCIWPWSARTLTTVTQKLPFLLNSSKPTPLIVRRKSASKVCDFADLGTVGYQTRSLDRGITHCYYNLRNANSGNLLCWENGGDGLRYERRLSWCPLTSKLSSSISLLSFCCQYIWNTAYFDAHDATNHPSNRLIRQDRDTLAGIIFSR